MLTSEPRVSLTYSLRSTARVRCPILPRSRGIRWRPWSRAPRPVTRLTPWSLAINLGCAFSEFPKVGANLDRIVTCTMLAGGLSSLLAVVSPTTSPCEYRARVGARSTASSCEASIQAAHAAGPCRNRPLIAVFRPRGRASRGTSCGGTLGNSGHRSGREADTQVEIGSQPFHSFSSRRTGEELLEKNRDELGLQTTWEGNQGLKPGLNGMWALAPRAFATSHLSCCSR